MCENTENINEQKQNLEKEKDAKQNVRPEFGTYADANGNDERSTAEQQHHKSKQPDTAERSDAEHVHPSAADATSAASTDDTESATGIDSKPTKKPVHENKRRQHGKHRRKTGTETAAKTTDNGTSPKSPGTRTDIHADKKHPVLPRKTTGNRI